MTDPKPIAPARMSTITRTEPGLRGDLNAGLRFIHGMTSDHRRDVLETAVTVLALVEELAENGAIELASLAARIGEITERELPRLEAHNHVRLEQSIDKYELASPDVPCEELIPLCRGRCCTLHFPLSKQDLNERVVRWDYELPYIIRQRDSDGYCVHSLPATRGCTVYHHRPAVCRTYDCRNDKRIWLDYEKRIPTIDPALTPKEAPVPDGKPPDKPWGFGDDGELIV